MAACCKCAELARIMAKACSPKIGKNAEHPVARGAKCSRLVRHTELRRPAKGRPQPAAAPNGYPSIYFLCAVRATRASHPQADARPLSNDGANRVPAGPNAAYPERVNPDYSGQANG